MPPPVKGVLFAQDASRLKSLLPVALRPDSPARGYFRVGLFLLAVLIVQQSTAWQWTVLTGLQDDNTYKLATGVGLLAFILYQWRFSIKRAQGEHRQAATMMGRHKLFGVLLPVLFFCHTQTVGYGYLQLLSLTLLLIFFTGLFNFQIVKIHTPWYRPVWISAHVGLSVALLLLMAYHVYLDYAFK
jgi:VIT1/CCC1 family predicted Fe2+/Mn2+ transporter